MSQTVLVTRPAAFAVETAAALERAGFTPVLAPLALVRGCPAALPAPGSLQAVVAASGNALGLPAHRDLPLLAVGEATAQRARAAGFTTVHSAEGDAAALAALAARLLSPGAGPLLLATGRGEGMRLAALLREAGFRVHRRAVYVTAAVRSFPAAAADAIQRGLHAALFFSASQARTFARLLPRGLRPRLADTVAISIAPGTQAALRHLPWRSLRVAVRPTQEAVLALL